MIFLSKLTLEIIYLLLKSNENIWHKEIIIYLRFMLFLITDVEFDCIAKN